VLDSAVQKLLERVNSDVADDELRKGIVEAMAGIADPRFSAYLRQHASADEPQGAIRQAALRGLGRIGDPENAPLVIERLKAEKDPAIRETAVAALGELGNQPGHLEAVRARLDPAVEKSAAVQQRAWEAYREIFTRLAPREQQQVIEAWPEEAIRLAADARIAPEAREQIIGRILDKAEAEGTDTPQAGLDLVDRLTQAIPPERLGSTWAARVAEIRQKLQAVPPSTTPAD
jgi:HEAT repeat protein